LLGLSAQLDFVVVAVVVVAAAVVPVVAAAVAPVAVAAKNNPQLVFNLISEYSAFYYETLVQHTVQ
jgi:hypothetical protein